MGIIRWLSKFQNQIKILNYKKAKKIDYNDSKKISKSNKNT